jgi:hypothetical protein
MGRPESKDEQVFFRVSDALKKQVAKAAKKDGRSISNYVSTMLESIVGLSSKKLLEYLDASKCSSDPKTNQTWVRIRAKVKVELLRLSRKENRSLTEMCAILIENSIRFAKQEK